MYGNDVIQSCGSNINVIMMHTTCEVYSGICASTLSSSHSGHVEHLCKGEWCVVRRQGHTEVPAECTGSKLGYPHNLKYGK